MASSPQSEPIEFDLGLLRAPLLRRRWGKKLAGLIHSYMTVASAKIDIQCADDAVTLALRMSERTGINALAPEQQDEESGLIIKSASISAIVLYMRATTTKSDVRSQLPVAKWLTSEQLRLHNRIKDLRNSGIGHFGRGGDGFSNAWSRETAVAVFDSRSTTYFFPAVSYNARARDLQAVKELIDVLKPLCVTEMTDRLRNVNDEFVRLSNDAENAEAFADLLLDHRFDPSTIYDANVAATLWSAHKEAREVHMWAGASEPAHD